MRFRQRLTAHEQYVGTVMLLAMLLVPLLVLVVPAATGRLRPWWVMAGATLGVGLAAALATGWAFGRSAKFRRSVTPLAYAHAFVWLAMLRCAAGAWLLVTGRTFSRMFSHRAPRLASVEDFAMAAALGLLAALCGYAAERSRAGQTERASG